MSALRRSDISVHPVRSSICHRGRGLQASSLLAGNTGSAGSFSLIAANAGSGPVANNGGIGILFTEGATYIGGASSTVIAGKGLHGGLALGTPLGGPGNGLAGGPGFGATGVAGKGLHGGLILGTLGAGGNGLQGGLILGAAFGGGLILGTLGAGGNGLHAGLTLGAALDELLG